MRVRRIRGAPRLAFATEERAGIVDTMSSTLTERKTDLARAWSVAVEDWCNMQASIDNAPFGQKAGFWSDAAGDRSGTRKWAMAAPGKESNSESSQMSEKDTLYDSNPPTAADFVFDERVARVFPDMIHRSVPGYALVLQMLGLMARRYVQPDSRVYDLGCSLGAATQVMRRAVATSGVRFVAVDNSAAMMECCRRQLNDDEALPEVEFVVADICRTRIENASMTVLNFTLQFIDAPQRLPLLKRIAAGTRAGGILVLSEKLRFADPDEQELHTRLHHDFKRDQGYSELEIAAKRNALERVLRPDTEAEHRERLRAAGWQPPVRCFQAYNFVSYLVRR